MVVRSALSLRATLQQRTPCQTAAVQRLQNNDPADIARGRAACQQTTRGCLQLRGMVRLTHLDQTRTSLVGTNCLLDPHGSLDSLRAALALQGTADHGLEQDGSARLTRSHKSRMRGMATNVRLERKNTVLERLELALHRVATPRRLNRARALIENVATHLFKQRQYTRAEKDLVETKVVLVRLDRLGQNILRQLAHLFQRVHGPVLRRHEHIVALDKVGESPAAGKSSTADPDRLEHTTGTQLAEHVLRLDFPGHLGVIGLDTSNIVHLGGSHRVHERSEGRLEL